MHHCACWAPLAEQCTSAAMHPMTMVYVLLWNGKRSHHCTGMQLVHDPTLPLGLLLPRLARDSPLHMTPSGCAQPRCGRVLLEGNGRQTRTLRTVIRLMAPSLALL